MLSRLVSTFAESYSYSYSYNADKESFAGSAVVIVIALLIFGLMLLSMWRIFVRAGKPGWAVLVPFYNTYIMLQIVGRPGWWLVLYFVPVVNLVIGVIVYYELAKAFGRGVGTLLLMLLAPYVGFPVLAFSNGTYKKPARA